MIFDQVTVAMKDGLIGEGQMCNWQKVSLQSRMEDADGKMTPLVAISQEKTHLLVDTG